MKNGLLLINLGTPDKPDKSSVRRYLKEFLSDKRVIHLPAPIRYLLLYGLILPFRPKQSAKAYQQIWTEQGSPLLVYSTILKRKLQQHLGPDYQVALGMRYGQPSLQSALDELSHCSNITILPLYPQYSSAATGSSLEKVMTILKNRSVLPSLKMIRDFYQHPAYIKTQAAHIEPYLQGQELILFSYHGIPENQILKGACKTLCQAACSSQSPQQAGCYRFQCNKTSALLAKQLGLSEDQYVTAFQSRLGKTPWVQPYTDILIQELAEKGIKKLAIACPSFVTDCLETLEEINMRLNTQWQKLTGKPLTFIPALNTNDDWVHAIGKMVLEKP